MLARNQPQIAIEGTAAGICSTGSETARMTTPATTSWIAAVATAPTSVELRLTNAMLAAQSRAETTK